MTDQTAQPGLESKPQAGDVSRRNLLRAAGVGAAVVRGWSLLEAWSSSIEGAGYKPALSAAGFKPKLATVADVNISNYTLFEIAYKAFASGNEPHNKEEVAAVIHRVVISDAVAGPMDFTSAKNPAPGVVITTPVGIQWQKGTKHPLEVTCCRPSSERTGVHCLS